jgi:hypothetical protein
MSEGWHARECGQRKRINTKRTTSRFRGQNATCHDICIVKPSRPSAERAGGRCLQSLADGRELGPAWNCAECPPSSLCWDFGRALIVFTWFWCVVCALEVVGDFTRRAGRSTPPFRPSLGLSRPKRNEAWRGLSIAAVLLFRRVCISLRFSSRRLTRVYKQRGTPSMQKQTETPLLLLPFCLDPDGGPRSFVLSQVPMPQVR